MGRAFEVRKAAMAKTSAQKTSLYSRFGKEIYQVAKNGGADINSNLSLRRLIDSAKKAQVPMDIINRAIEKAKGVGSEDYQSLTYEVFGPGSSQIIVECLSDNVNRAISELRAILNKCRAKLGAKGSITCSFSHYSVYELSTNNPDELLLDLMENGVEVEKTEDEDGLLIIYSPSGEHHKIASLLDRNWQQVPIENEGVIYLATEKVTLSHEDKEIFQRLCLMLEEADDIQEYFHNVAEN